MSERSSLSLIDSLSIETSHVGKARILREAFMMGEREFFTLARVALDPLANFGVTKAPRIEPEDDDEPGTLSITDFLTLCRRLASRDLAGDSARNALNLAAQRCHAPTWNRVYRRVILKNLGCGVDAEMINSVLDAIGPSAMAYRVPVFSCQLAQDGSDVVLSGRRLVDMQLKGTRLISLLDPATGMVEQRSPSGKLVDSFPIMASALRKMLPSLPGGIVLDGIVVTDSFEDLMSRTTSKSDPDARARLALIDILPLEDFRRGRCLRPLSERHSALAELEMMGVLRTATSGLVWVLPKVSVDFDDSEGRSDFESLRADAAKAGYPGVVIKDPDSEYVGGENSAWLKIRFHDPVRFGSLLSSETQNK